MEKCRNLPTCAVICHQNLESLYLFLGGEKHVVFSFSVLLSPKIIGSEKHGTEWHRQEILFGLHHSKKHNSHRQSSGTMLSGKTIKRMFLSEAMAKSHFHTLPFSIFVLLVVTFSTCLLSRDLLVSWFTESLIVVLSTN